MNITVGPDQKLRIGERIFDCALGKGGITANKREGDGASPVGVFALRYVMYRPDRLEAPYTALNIQKIHKEDGWCDDPAHPDYNRAVTLPFEASHEKLWREDHLYDIIVVLGHNDDPPVPNKGSAIFFHIAKESYQPTEGCVAVYMDDMLEILKMVDQTSTLEIKLS